MKFIEISKKMFVTYNEINIYSGVEDRKNEDFKCKKCKQREQT